MRCDERPTGELLGELVVMRLPPDPRRVHWGLLVKEKHAWATELYYLARAAGVPPCEPGERRAVHVALRRPGPESDRDNAASRMKVPLDALVRAGLIEDDRPGCVDVTWSTHPEGRRGRTVISLHRAVPSE